MRSNPEAHAGTLAKVGTFATVGTFAIVGTFANVYTFANVGALANAGMFGNVFTLEPRSEYLYVCKFIRHVLIIINLTYNRLINIHLKLCFK